MSNKVRGVSYRSRSHKVHGVSDRTSRVNDGSVASLISLAGRNNSLRGDYDDYGGGDGDDYCADGCGYGWLGQLVGSGSQWWW